MCLLVFMARRTLWVILPLTLVVSSAFRTMRGVRSFSVFMLYFLTSFQWIKLVLAPLSMRACFWTLRFPLCDLNSIGMVKAYLLGFVARIEKRSPGYMLRFATM